MTIQLDKRAIRAALEFAATQDIRYFLNGIKIEATKTHTTYVATDGHRMIAVRHEAENEQAADLIIPKRVANLASKGMGQDIDDDDALITITADQHDITTPDGRLIFTPIQGNYPDWRKFLSDYKKPGGHQAGSFLSINPKYLKKCFDAANHLRARSFPVVTIYESDTTQKAVNVQAGITPGFDLWIAVMPCDDRHSGYQNNDWINENAD